MVAPQKTARCQRGHPGQPAQRPAVVAPPPEHANWLTPLNAEGTQPRVRVQGNKRQHAIPSRVPVPLRIIPAVILRVTPPVTPPVTLHLTPLLIRHLTPLLILRPTLPPTRHRTRQRNLRRRQPRCQTQLFCMPTSPSEQVELSLVSCRELTHWERKWPSVLCDPTSAATGNGEHARQLPMHMFSTQSLSRHLVTQTHLSRLSPTVRWRSGLPPSALKLRKTLNCLRAILH